MLNSNGNGDSGDDDFPAIAADGQGQWIIAWHSTDTLGGVYNNGNNLYYALSSNHGDSWTAPAPVNPDAGVRGGGGYSVHLTYDGLGSWAAVWAYQGYGGDPDLVYSTMPRTGGAWSAFQPVNPWAQFDGSGVGDGAFPMGYKVTSDGRGNWVVAWNSQYDQASGTGQDWDVMSRMKLSCGTAVNKPELAWSGGGNAPWFGTLDNSHDSTHSAQSGQIADNQSSTLSTTITGPGSLSFWWASSSEANHDFLRFYLDDAEQPGAISGSADWQPQSVQLLDGTHTLKWEYEKDNCGAAGADCGWIDQVTLTPFEAVPMELSVTTLSDASLKIKWGTLAGTTNYKLYRKNPDGTTVLVGTTTGLELVDTAGLQGGTRYSYWLLVMGTGAPKVSSDVASGVTLPRAPAVTVSTLSNRSMHLGWPAVTGATGGYRIYRSNAQLTTPTLLGVASNPTYDDLTCPDEATCYYYRVKAVGEAGESAFSNIANGWTAPNPPVSLTVRADDAANPSSSMLLTFTDHSERESGFIVERSSNGTDGWTSTTLPMSAGVGGQVSYHDVNGITEGKHYWYRVKARLNMVAESFTSGVTDGWSRLIAPTNLVVARDPADPASQVRLSWTDSSQRETGYCVERSYDGWVSCDALPMLAAGTTSTLDTGLISGTVVNYRVRAVIANVVESLNATATSYQVPPGAPSVTVTGSGGAMAEVSWSTVAGAMSYDVYMLDENGYWVLVAPGVNGLSWIDRTSGLGRACGYRVVARLPGGVVSAASTTVSTPQGLFKLKNDQDQTICMITEDGRLIHSGATLECTAQTAVAALAAMSGVKLWRVDDANGQTLAAVVMSKGASTSKEGDLLLRGRLYVNDPNMLPSAADPHYWFPPSGPSMAIASLDTAGNLKVCAYEGWGPCNLAATALPGTAILLKWTDFTTQTTSMEVFKVERSRDDRFTTATDITSSNISAQGTDFSCIDTGLEIGQQYFYRVSRILRGRPWYSNVANTWTHPPKPHFTMIAPTSNHSILMAWDPVTSAGVRGYKIYRAENESQFGTLASLKSDYTSATVYHDDGNNELGPLSGLKTYYYLLKAVNPGGESDTGDTTSTATMQDPKLSVTATMTGTNSSENVSVYCEISHPDNSVTTLSLATPSFPPLILQPGDKVVLGDFADPRASERIILGWKVNGQWMSKNQFVSFKIDELRDYFAEAVYTGFGLYYPDPAFEDGAVPPASNINAVFNKAPDRANFMVYGAATGRFSGNTIKGLDNAYFNPDTDFRAGETISVTLTTETQDSHGNPLDRPAVWRYTAKTSDAKQPTSYSLARGFAQGADVQSSASCLAAVSLYSTTTLQMVIGVYGGPNRIEYIDPASSVTLSRTFDQLWSDYSNYTTVYRTTAIAAADLNPRDADSATADLIVVNDGGPSYVYISPKSTLQSFSFSKRTMFAQGDAAQAVAVGDLNGDGFQDVVLGNRGQRGTIYFNDGYGNLNRGNDFYGNGRANVTAVAVADMNLDGALDIIAGCYGSGQNRIYLNDGTGHFSDDASTTRSIAFGPANPMTTSLAVVNTRNKRDGAYPDIVVGNYGQPSKVYLNTSGGTLQFEEVGLTDAQGRETAWPTRAVAAGDFNADGFIDVALGNDSASPNLIYFNEGRDDPKSQDPNNRVFRLRGRLGASGTEAFETRGLVSADYDGDGDLDLAVLQQGAPGQLFLRGESEPSPAQSIFKVPAGKDSLCYAYDWAVDMPGYNFIDTYLTFPSDWRYDQKLANYNLFDDIKYNQFDDEMPDIATDGNGHWVLAWATNNNLNYTTTSNTDPLLKNFDLQDDSDIVVSRFWDQRGTLKNSFDPLHKDVWSTITMDRDVLWTPPVPVDEVNARDDRPEEMPDKTEFKFEAPIAYDVPPFQDKAPSIATDGHGNWAVVWVAYDVVYDTPPYGDMEKPSSGHGYLRKPIVKMSISKDDAKTWSQGIFIRDLKMEPYVNCIITPKIACDQVSPTSTWIVTYPSTHDSTNYVWPLGADGQHRSYDTDIYISKTVTTLQNDGSFAWSSDEPSFTTLCLNANSPLVTVTEQLRDNGMKNYHYYGYKDGDVIDDPYDSTDPNNDSCRPSNTNNYNNSDCISQADDGIGNHFGDHPLDLATDGMGHWLAVWVSNVKSLKTSEDGTQSLTLGGDKEILFAFSSNNGTTWTYPSTVNSTMLSDNKNGTSDEREDLNPTIATIDGKWIVLWETHNPDPSQFDCSNVPGSGELNKWGAIASSMVATKQLDKHTPSGFYASTPWSKAKIVNPDARRYTNKAPRLCAMGNDRLMAVWNAYIVMPDAEKFVTKFAISTDGGATWDSSDKNILFSKGIPPQSGNHQQAIAGDSSGNAVVTWAVTSGVNQDFIPHDIGDFDIVTARTAGLLTGDNMPVPIRPLPTPTPTPAPVVVQADLSGMPPAKVPNLAGLPEGLAECGAFERAALPATLPSSTADSIAGPGSAMIFHMPLLDGTTITRVRDIRQVDLNFKAGRNTPAKYRVFVFKGGHFGAGEWVNPAAWEEVCPPAGVNMNWKDSVSRSLPLTGNFERYLTAVRDEAIKFGPAGQDVILTTGTLTWAVYSLPDDGGKPGGLSFDSAQVVVWPAVRPPAPPATDDLTHDYWLNHPSNTLTLWARVEAGQVATHPAPPCATRGDVRLTLLANPSSGEQGGVLNWSLSLQGAARGMQVRLRGYAERNWAPGTLMELTTLCTLTSDGLARAQGSWSYTSDPVFGSGTSRPNNLNNFITSLLAGQVYLELTGPNGGAGFARGQVEPDRDDDGLTDYEEDKNHNGGVDAGETNLFDRDTDDDGLLDGEEVLAAGLLAYTKKSDPYSLDKEGSDPLKVDTDGDGLADGLEAGLTTNTLNSRQSTITKRLSWRWDRYSGVDSHVIEATTPTLAGGIHKVTGLRLIDADPATVTNPQKPDTDGDHYWDGPDVWVDMGRAGLQLHMGEDANGNGRVDAMGLDSEFETLDDETDPINKTSFPEEDSILANDSDKDGLPDALEAEEGTLPLDADTDDDGVSDGDEVLVYGTHPLFPDTDWDGLPDGLELGIAKSKTTDATVTGKTYAALRRGYQLVNGQLDLIQNIPTYLERNYAPLCTNPWEVDSNYDGKTDRESDWNGNGQIDTTETDPVRGLVAEPKDRETFHWREVLKGDEAYSIVHKPSPPVSSRYRLVFFFNSDVTTDTHWEAPVYLAKGSGSDFPVLAVEPLGAADIVYEPNPKADHAGLKFARIRTTGANISSFVIKVLTTANGPEIASYRISLEPDSYYEWLHTTQSGGQYASMKVVNSRLSKESRALQSGVSNGTSMPPVDAGGLFSTEEGMFFSDKIATIAGTDRFDALDFAYQLFDEEARNAMINGVIDMVGKVMSGDIQIGPNEINAFVRDQAITLLKGMAKIPCIMINLTFRYGVKPLEFWTIWITDWHENLNLESPEEFLGLSYSIILGMVDSAVVNSTMNQIEENHGWAKVLGYPDYFDYDELTADVPAEEADNLSPGWIIVPGEEASEDSPLQNFKSVSGSLVRSAASPAPISPKGLSRSPLKAQSITKCYRGKSSERLAAIVLKHGVKLDDGTFLKIKNLLSMQYSGGKGTDGVGTATDGTPCRNESKHGKEPKAGEGRKKGVKWRQHDPRHNIISDVKHLIYGNGNDPNLPNVELTMAERYQAIQMKRDLGQLDKDYYDAVHYYAQGVNAPDPSNSVRDWLKGLCNGNNAAPVANRYGLNVVSIADIDALPDSALIEFKDHGCNLMFDYLKAKNRRLYNRAMEYWSKVKLIFGTDIVKNPLQKMRGLFSGQNNVVSNADAFCIARGLKRRGKDMIRRFSFWGK